MKHLLPPTILFGAALLLSTVARAAPAPADTVVGQAHFVKLMSTGMCDKLAQESQQADLTKLSPAESEALLKKLLMTTLGNHFAEFSALLEKVGKTKAEGIGRAIGEQAVFDMVQSCPNAAPLLAKAGSGHVPGGAELTPAERNVLLPITQDACKRLDAENAKQPLAQRTPAQRTAVFQQVVQGVFLSNSEALTQQYGEEALEDEAQAAEIGKKMGLLMVEFCPSYVVQAGRDMLANQRATAPAPAAAAPVKKPAARAKTPAPKVRK